MSLPVVSRLPPPPVKTGERLYTLVPHCVQVCLWQGQSVHGGAGAGRCGEGRARRGAGAVGAGWRKPVRWKEAPFLHGAITPQGSLQQQVQGQGKGRLAPGAAGTPQRPAAARLAPGGTRKAPGRHPTRHPARTQQGTSKVMPLPRPSTPSRTPQNRPRRSSCGTPKRKIIAPRRVVAGRVLGRPPGRVRRGWPGRVRHGGAARCWAVRRGAGPVRRVRCDAVPGRAGAAACRGCGGCGATRVTGCGWPVRRAGRCGGATGPPGAVRRAAREGDPPAWVFWLLANGRKGHVPTPATNRLVAKPEKKYCGVCPMP